MLEMVTMATQSHVTPLQLQSVYDGLEGLVHYKEDSLIRRVVSLTYVLRSAVIIQFMNRLLTLHDILCIIRVEQDRI